MKVTYLKLVNVAGLLVGSNKKEIEILFDKCKNNIVAIQGINGIGKSVLLSSISPFSGPTTVDERSTLNYIVLHKEGYKEIHYQVGDDKYIIKHYYKPTKESHSVKSYISRNGEELNKNGNVRSFLSLVEINFGLTEEMMRLIRIGTNVNSFVTLTPARRKEYIGKLIDEIDSYLIIHKEISNDKRVVKTLIANNNANLYKCHISDLVVEEDRLAKLNKEVKKLEREKDKLVGEIGRLVELISKNDIDDVKRKKHELESSLREIDELKDELSHLGLLDVSVDKLIKRRSNLSDDKISIQSKINSYRLSIDTTLKQIEQLELSVKKITSNNDVQSLVNSINSLRADLENSAKLINGFIYTGATSDEMQYIVSKLMSFNQISQMIYTFGNRPLDAYLKLKHDGKSVDKFLKDQSKKLLSGIKETDLQALLDQVFNKDDIITPNCSTEFYECPYYRLNEVIYTLKNKIEEETFDDETLRYIQVISNNIDNILNELDRMKGISIPDRLKDQLSESHLMSQLNSKSSFFMISEFQEYLSMIKEYELYQRNYEKLKGYEYQLSIYKKSGIDTQISQIKELHESIDFYNSNIEVLSGDIKKTNEMLDEIDHQISLVSKYQDGKKYKKMFESTLESTIKILGPLETATQEKAELDFRLRQLTNQINLTRQEHKDLEMKIAEYKRLVDESKKLSEQSNDLDAILDAVSTKEGIPVVYIKKYLGKIKKLTNNLLSLIYDDDFQLTKFNVNADTFEIPYVKNGIRVSDIKYASQSEVALATMALSFALASRAANQYNILLLDEIDAGLDANNRSSFLKMLSKQMSELNAEQVFIISHNMSQMINIPMDCIRLSEVDVNSKMQNVIYDAAA